MRRIQVRRRELPAGAEVLAPPRDDHYEQVVRESALVYDGDELVVAFSDEIGEHDDLLRAVQGISYQTGHRTGGKGGGMLSTSRIFGYRSRVTVRKDYCSLASLARESPAQHAVLENWAARAAGFYRAADPEKYRLQSELVASKVLPDWVIPNSPFTSGIVNHNNPLRYHHDTGNFPGLWSVMAALTRDVDGGYLVVPEYGVAFSFERPSLIAFDGQGLLHGVSPIHRQSPRGYRYSVVWYSLQQMAKCLPPAEELRRIRTVKTERERRRAGQPAHLELAAAAAAAAARIGVTEPELRRWWAYMQGSCLSPCGSFVLALRDASPEQADVLLADIMAKYPVPR